MKKKGVLILVLLAGIGLIGNAGADTAFSQNSPADAATENHQGEGQAVNIRLSFRDGTATVRLNNNPASRDFLSLLPVTLTVEDYAGTEKIGYLPRKLKTQGAPSGCKPSVGTVAYYAPWGNLAIFYHEFRYSNGLVPLGDVESGMEKLAEMHGDFPLRIEVIE